MKGHAMYEQVRGSAGDDLVLNHAPLVKRIAHHLASRLPPSVQVDDLMQAGVIGLLVGALSAWFVLAVFLGVELITKVPPTLHTPLMSGSNFVHGIVLIGAMVALGHADSVAEQIIGFIAVFLGAGNAVGGYFVTERMLEMFKSSGDREKRA